MKAQNGFTLMNKNEIGTYLAKQNVTRKITRVQVHHMDLLMNSKEECYSNV